jgi:DNA-binding CsgD family transcriptional regulator
MEGALRSFLEGFRFYREVGDLAGYAEALEALALIGSRIGEYNTSATMIGAASALRERINSPVQAQEQDRFNQAVSLGHRGLGQDAWSRAWEQGRALSLADIETLIVESGERWLVQGARERIPPEANAAVATTYRLTQREMDVLRMLGAGHSDREIADELFISIRTVGTHVSNILAKLNVPSRSAAVSVALREHILR